MTPTQAPRPNEESPRCSLQNMIGGFRVSQMISVAAKLRIADRLGDGTKTVAELASASRCHEDSLYRLLRALAAIGIFAEEDGPAFRLTPSAELLRSDVPGSLRASAEVVGEEWMWRPWGSLLHSVTTGETAFDYEYGKNKWDWFTGNPSAGRLFDQFMDEITNIVAQAVVAAYDFSMARLVVDISGGRGGLLAEILRCNGSARGMLFDLPPVIAAAKICLGADVASRIEFVPGNVFREVPAGGDVYIMKNILHDWNDDAAREILTACRRAMSAHATLLIIEHVLSTSNDGIAGKLGDISMLVGTGGRNRTKPEFQALLRTGGFNLSRILQTAAGPEIIEASAQS